MQMVTRRLSSALRTVALFIFVCATGLPALGDDLEKGIAAYRKEDYKKALKLLKPLADQGVADA